MKKQLDIICLAFPSWYGNYVKSTVQLMKELASNHHVLYVDYAYTWKDLILNIFHNPYIPVKKILGITPPLEKITLENNATIHVLSLPPLIPYNWITNLRLFKYVQMLNQKLVRGRIQNAMLKLNMENPILVNAFNPYFDEVTISNIHPKASFYYCYDNIDAAQWALKHGRRLEKALIEAVDAMVFSSRALAQSKSITGKSSFVIRNGVDLSLFEKEMKTIVPVEKGQGIHIGYVGSIDQRLDYPMLEKMIQRQKDWTFHFVGRVMAAEAVRLKGYSNVRFYGAVPIVELPGLIKKFDAGIIPFIKDDFTKNIYPMKANEYLAMGVPVVMTDFARLDDLANVVSVADGEDFLDQLTRDIESDSPEKKALRTQVAAQNSWKNKADELANIFLQYA